MITVPGAPGLTGLGVPRAVVEEVRPGGDTAKIHSQSGLVTCLVWGWTALDITLKRDIVLVLTQGRLGTDF